MTKKVLLMSGAIVLLLLVQSLQVAPAAYQPLPGQALITNDLAPAGGECDGEVTMTYAVKEVDWPIRLKGVVNPDCSVTVSVARFYDDTIRHYGELEVMADGWVDLHAAGSAYLRVTDTYSVAPVTCPALILHDFEPESFEGWVWGTGGWGTWTATAYESETSGSPTACARTTTQDWLGDGTVVGMPDYRMTTETTTGGQYTCSFRNVGTDGNLDHHCNLYGVNFDPSWSPDRELGTVDPGDAEPFDI